jgi:hypothetical protein
LTPAAKAGLWLVGAILIVLLLDLAPKLGGALLFILVVYLASEVTRKGVV